MATNFETIWEALRARLEANAPTFLSVVRHERTWGLEQLPAIEVWDNGDETPRYDDDGLPPLWSAAGSIIILDKPVESFQTMEAMFSRLNALIHEVKTALERTPTDPAAAGALSPGAVSHWTNLGIEGLSLSVGRVAKGSSGQRTGNAMAEIAIEIATY